jgi:hypothetical protein
MSHDVDATCPDKKISSSDREILISDVQAIPHLWNDGQPDNKKTIITSEPSLEGCGTVYAGPVLKICTKKSQIRQATRKFNITAFLSLFWDYNEINTLCFML